MSANGSSVTRILSFFFWLKTRWMHKFVTVFLFKQASLHVRVYLHAVLFLQVYFLRSLTKIFLHFKKKYMGIIFLGLNFVSQSLGEVAYLLCSGWDELGTFAAHTHERHKAVKSWRYRGPFFVSRLVGMNLRGTYWSCLWTAMTRAGLALEVTPSRSLLRYAGDVDESLRTRLVSRSCLKLEHGGAIDFV